MSARPDTVRLALDLMVIGAAKSATSSLVELLHTAPGVTSNPTGAEVSYFLHDDEFRRGPAPALAKYFATAPGSGELRIGKSAGLMYSPTGVERLRADSPGVRTVAVLREPVARAYSAYLWASRAGFETDTFDDAIDRELAGRDLDLPRPWLRRYLGHGEYARHVEAARAILAPGTFDVITMPDFVADPTGCADRLLAPFDRTVPAGAAKGVHTNRASGVRSTQLARVMRSPKLRTPLRKVLPLKAQVALARGAKRANEATLDSAPMADVTRARLVAHFAPWNERLAALLDRDLGWG